MGKPRKFATEELTNLVVQVDTDFEDRVVKAAFDAGYRGNKSDWARDLVAKALGFDSYAAYAQFVKGNPAVNQEAA